MRTKIAVLLSVVLCGSATAEPAKYAQPELRLTAERLESEVTNSASSISKEDEGTKAAAELPRIEATTDEKATALQPDQTEPTSDEETNIPAPLADKRTVAEVSNSWEAGASGLIAYIIEIDGRVRHAATTAAAIHVGLIVLAALAVVFRACGVAWLVVTAACPA
jgi:hypothetical protein